MLFLWQCHKANLNRVNFSAGTGTTYGPTSKRSATNAATTATSLIGTGERVKIYESPHSSMAATLVYQEMVLISLEETLHASPLMTAASSVLNLLTVGAVSLLVLSKSRLKLSSLFL
jgi:hypothetical protein